MRPLEDFGISSWSWLAPSGCQSHHQRSSAVSEAERLPWLLDRCGLAPHPTELGLSGSFGRVQEPLDALPTHLARHRSRCTELLMKALRPIDDCLGRAVRDYGAERVAIVLGSSTGGIDATERALRQERLTGAMPEDYSFEEAHVYHALIRLVQRQYGLRGPGFVVSTACSSSGKALGAAQRLLAAGRADAVLTGGVDALCEMTLRGFGGLGILSPEGAKPFDATRNGISIGEGAALMLIERSCASPYALLGVGESADAHHVTAPHPEGAGATLAMQRVMTLSEIAPRQVDYINGHGTGTVQNDSTEARAILQACGADARFSSTKDRIGHQLGTAGATEALFCLQALAHQRIPLNRLPDRIDETLALQPQLRGVEPPPRLHNVLSNSFAFGGSNVSVALGLRRPAADEAPVSPHDRSLSMPARRRLACVLPGRAYVMGQALWARGFPTLRSWLQERPEPSCTTPAARALAARPRGRASLLTRIFAELYAQLRDDQEARRRFDESSIATVYGSAYGEMSTTIQLLDQLSTEPTLSPARFQSSVHNTAGGQLSIATKNRSFSTAIAAGSSTVAMSLLDACSFLATQGGEAVVMIADEDGPLRLLRRDGFPALGVGLHLRWSEDRPAGALASLSPPVSCSPRSRPDGASRFMDSPAGWGLSLLRAISNHEPGRIVVGHRWEIDLVP